MEDFSTPRRPLLPLTANLCTLAVVLAATWWSGAQRAGSDGEAAQQSRSQPMSQPVAAADLRAEAPAWVMLGTSADAAKVKADSGVTLQPVGYQAAAAR
jgi:hypothetical protein